MTSPIINVHLDDTLTTSFAEAHDTILTVTLGVAANPHMVTLIFHDHAYAELKKAMREYENREINALLKQVVSVAYEQDNTCKGCGIVRGLEHLGDCAIGQAEARVKE